jgi:hypothetical protein
MSIPSEKEIRLFYGEWLKAEYGMDTEQLPSPAIATVVDFTQAAIEKFGYVSLDEIDDWLSRPYADQLDCL